MKKPRIIVLDIERTHSLVTVFQLKHNDYIGADNIMQESFIPTASWKVLGEKKVYGVSTLDDPKRFAKDPTDDYHVVKTLHDVISSADCIIAHNGDAFDLPFTEGRILYHGLSPLPPTATIDTLKVARKRFLFNANNLNYLGQFLKCGKKLETEPGLWYKVLKGDKSAIKRMLKYNKQDVLLLEKVYFKLQPYIANHVNRHLFGGSGCPRCGSLKIQSRGEHRALTQVYQRYACTSCGGWFRELKGQPKKAAKTRIL